MLSFLHRWDYCWKREFDTDVKVGKSFYKKVHVKTQGNKKDGLVIFVLFQFIWQKVYSKEPQLNR